MSYNDWANIPTIAELELNDDKLVDFLKKGRYNK